MSLIDLAMSVALGNRKAPDQLELGLFAGGKEIVDAGYVRATVAKGAWTLRNGTAECTGRFGPFASDVTFDRVALLRGNEVLEEDVTGVTTVPARSTFIELVFGSAFAKQ